MSKKSRKQKRAVKKLSKDVKKLRGRLTKQEAETAKWKRRAKRSSAKAQRLASQPVATALAVVPPDGHDDSAIAPDGDTETVTVTAYEASPEPGLPDESWTVTRLRGSARQAGIPGYSRMSKAALLDALSKPPVP